MKRKFAGFALIIVLIIILATIVSCDKNNYTNIGTSHFTFENDKYVLNLPNKTDTLDLSTYIYVSEYASWEISETEDFAETIEKNVNLKCGNNTFYIKVTDKNSNSMIYTFNIYRNSLYTVQFNTNGGTECSNQIVEEGTLASVPASVKAGYDLKWDFDFSTPITSNITVNANWTAKKYTITISAPNTIMDKKVVNVEFGKEYIIDEPEKEGYHFSGWTANGVNFVVSGLWMGTSNITVTALFEKNNYSINYLLNGGKNSENNPTTYTIEDEIILSIPTREDNAEFLGWFLEDGTNVTEIKRGSTGNIVFYAKWREVDPGDGKDDEYSITFDADGLEIDETTQNVQYGKDYSLPAPQKYCYIFEGWKFENIIVPQNGKWTIEKDVTLTAVWTPVRFSVTYILYDGVNSTDNPLYYTIESNKIILVNPEKANYIFEGWFTNSDFNEDSRVTEIAGGLVGNIILYAKWQVKDKSLITYDANGGVISNGSQIIAKNENYILAIPERAGYVFNGWYNNDISVQLNGVWNISGDVTLKAAWEIINYNITYNLGTGGVSGNPLTYNIETDTFSLLPPTREGYIFMGWSGTEIIDFTESVTVYKGTTGAREYTAKWFRKVAANGVVYDYKNGEAIVVGYQGGYNNVVIIPSVYEDCNVVSIKDEAFLGMGNKLSQSGFTITIPESVNHIGKDAFKECVGLSIILMPGVDIETWISKLFIESGNDQVLDVIRNERPAIGWSKYV